MDMTATLPGMTTTRLPVIDDEDFFFREVHKTVRENVVNKNLGLNEKCVELLSDAYAYNEWRTGDEEQDDVEQRRIFRQEFLQQHLEKLIGENLSGIHWQVFNARYMLNLRYGQIAHMLRIGVGKPETRRQWLVKQILKRCVRKLQKRLAPLKEM
jgi:DNA-directed RNA polymerase specialized sigma subunit